jgi:hypothetical protein
MSSAQLNITIGIRQDDRWIVATGVFSSPDSPDRAVRRELCRVQASPYQKSLCVREAFDDLCNSLIHGLAEAYSAYTGASEYKITMSEERAE